MGGFLVNAFGFGLGTRSWVVLLLGMTLAGATAAWVRRAHLTEPRDRRVALRPRIRPRLGPTLLAVLALLLAGAAIALARTPLPAKGAQGYTVLWMLPGGDDPATIRVGVISSELRTTSYRLDMRAGDGRLWSRSLTLAPRQNFEAVLNVASVPMSRRSIVAALYRTNSAATGPAYRWTTLVLPGATAPPTTLIWLFALNPTHIRVGVMSAAPQSAAYRLEMYAGSERRWVWRLKLAPGQQWDAVVRVQNVPPRRRSFEALLYRAGEYAPEPALRRATFALPGATAAVPRVPAAGNTGP
jgi:hypothetical protein